MPSRSAKTLPKLPSNQDNSKPRVLGDVTNSPPPPPVKRYRRSYDDTRTAWERIKMECKAKYEAKLKAEKSFNIPEDSTVTESVQIQDFKTMDLNVGFNELLSDSDEYFTAEDSFQSQNDSEYFFNFYKFIFI
jgi:hypothetical protein